MYAIIKTGSKQYKVQEGDILNVDKLSLESKSIVEFSEVLAIGGEAPKFGTPLVNGAVVTAEVINEGRDKKIVIFKKRRRKDSKVKRGFRKSYTRIRVTKIAA